MEDSIRAGQRIGGLHPGHVIAQRLVRDHDPFGFTGRAGGIDHIGQVAGSHIAAQLIARLAGDGGPIRVQTDQFRPGIPQPRKQALPGQQHRRLRIRYHIGNPLFGIIRVKRDVGSAGFERPKNGDDQLWRAIQTDTYQAVRRYTQAL